MQPLRIAYRNVLRQAKRSLLLGGAIAFGFFIFTLLNGFTGGLVGSVSQNLARNLGGQLYVSGSVVSDLGSEVSVVRNTSTLDDALVSIREQIVSSNTRSSARVSVIFASREEVVELTGVNFTQETGVLDTLELASGSTETFLANKAGILLPEGTVQALGLEPGESVIVKTTTVTGQQNVSDFVLLGSLTEQELLAAGTTSQSYAHLGAVNELLGLGEGQYQTLNLYLNDTSELETVTNILYTALAETATVEPRDTGGFALPDPAEFLGFGGPSRVDEAERWQGTKFEVTNLNDQLEGVTALVTLINAVGWTVFIVILLIIMVGVMNAYRMVMIERTAEIGTMRAMGVQKAGIRNIFVWEALVVALGGTLAGLVLAAVTMAGIGLIDFGSGGALGLFLNQGHLAFDLALFDTLFNIVLICVLSAAAVYVPARAAARLEPAEALRAG